MTSRAPEPQRVSRALLGAGVLDVAPDVGNRSTWPRFQGRQTPVAYRAAGLGLDPAALDVVALALEQRILVRGWRPDIVVAASAAGASLAPLLGRGLGTPHLVIADGSSDVTALGASFVGDHALIVDHFIVAGDHAEGIVKLLKDHVTVIAVLAVTTAGNRRATERLAQHGVPLDALLTLGALVTDAVAAGVLAPAIRDHVLGFYRDSDSYDWAAA
jgi:adenine/guanine phosphoribosyltransferase-like PRPP-binding protein